MATPTFVRTTVSKDGTKLRDEYSDGSFKNVRANPDFISPRQKIINDAVAAQAAKDAAIQAAKDAAKGKGPESRIQQAAKKLDTEYDVYKDDVIKAAEEKGYTINKIDPAYRYTGKTVGSQRNWDPESGFYYNSSAVAPGKAGLDKYIELHKDIIDEYVSPDDNTKGSDAWKRDHLKYANEKDASGKFARKDPAIKHVVNNINKRHQEIAGKDLIDVTKPDAYVPGVQLFNLPGISKKKETVPPGGDKTIADTGNKKKDDETKPFETNTPVNQSTPGNTPFWLQDIIQTAGAASDLARLKKYLPWQATPEVRLPDATFYDPTRELAANTEQANLASQAQTAFSGPQQLAAANSVAQGQAAKNAADTMGRYNNLNVGLANQLSQERTGIMNAASQNKANLDTQLWDKYTIANQQFDNSKTKARQNLRSSFIDAITNRANTANMNSLYPEYYADPSTGGFIKFNPNAAKIKPIDKYNYLDPLWEKAKTMDPNDPKGMLKILLGKGATDPEEDAYNDYYNKLKKMTERGYNSSQDAG